MKHILWTYDHPTARDQEMLLFKSKNSAVIPTFSGVNHYQGYNDETHVLYPRWRSNVKIPLNEVEEIRINFSSNSSMSKRLKSLVNKHIDYIFINCEPDELKNLLSWYKHIILFRCNGGPNTKYLDWQTSQWVNVIKKMDATHRVIYLPGHETIFIEKFNEANIRVILQNVYVDTHRFNNLKYNPIHMKRISCAISYYEHHDSFREHFNNIKEVSKNFDLQIDIFGKNRKKKSFKNIDVKGTLEHFEMWSNILSNKLFIDVGQNPLHTIFPPLEAMMLGMPVVFPRNNGHVQSLEKTLDIRLSSNEGVFDTLEECLDFASNSKIKDLVIMHENQFKIFSRFFSKKNARAAALNSIDVDIKSEIENSIQIKKDPLRIIYGLIRVLRRTKRLKTFVKQNNEPIGKIVFIADAQIEKKIELIDNFGLRILRMFFGVKPILEMEDGSLKRVEIGLNNIPLSVNSRKCRLFGSPLLLLIDIEIKNDA